MAQPPNYQVRAAKEAPRVASYSGANWMGALDAGRSLARISLPGTHDSGARFEMLPGTTACQTLTIAEQLDAGVRYLDIRCRHVRNAFAIHHGPVFQQISFDDVLNTCMRFVKNNPAECIIMSVKEEYIPSGNTRSFEQTFDAYAANNPGKWLLSGTIPSLGEARGKIVLLRRFQADSTPKGINAVNWRVNAAFSIAGPLAKLSIQDRYIVRDNREKWAAVKKLYREALSAKDEPLHINFASGYRRGLLGLPDIAAVCDFMNPALRGYFSKNKKGAFGITVMDFAGEAECACIVAANFRANP